LNDPRVKQALQRLVAEDLLLDRKRLRCLSRRLPGAIGCGER